MLAREAQLIVKILLDFHAEDQPTWPELIARFHKLAKTKPEEPWP